MYAPERGEHLQPLKAAAALGAAFLCTPEAKGKSNRGVEGGGSGTARSRWGPPERRFRLAAFGRKKKKDSERISERGRDGDRAAPGDAPERPSGGLGAGEGAARRGKAASKLLSNGKAIRMSSKKVLTRALSLIM